MKNFFSKCDQIHRKLRIWSKLLKKCLMENFIFCAVTQTKFRRLSEKRRSSNSFLSSRLTILLKIGSSLEFCQQVIKIRQIGIFLDNLIDFERFFRSWCHVTDILHYRTSFDKRRNQRHQEKDICCSSVYILMHLFTNLQ